MIHGINNTYLYVAKKIITVCSNGTDTLPPQASAFGGAWFGRMVARSSRIA